MAKNALTLDGRLKLQPGVTKAKVDAIKVLVEDTMAGKRISRGILEETLTSSDAIFSYAHLTNLNFLPQFDRLEPTWKAIAGTRTVSDFRKPILYSMVTNWDGLEEEGVNPGLVAPIVPEGAPYPFATMAGEEALAGGITKRGFKTGFTFEAFINDSLGFIAALPGEMLRIAKDTQDYETYGALINGTTSASQLTAFTVPDGTAVLANDAVSRASLTAAIIQLSQRKINGRLVVVTGGYNLIVPVGQGIGVDFILKQILAQLVDGSYVLNIEGYNPLASITPVESQWVTGTNWYLLPKPGATVRPVLEHATLAGHEAAELRVEDTKGTYVGGGEISPFEGSFDNDSAVFRLRMLGGGILWSPFLVVWSTGAKS